MDTEVRYMMDEQYIPSPSIYLTQTDHGAVLLDIQQSVFLGINRMGLRIWEDLCERKNFKEIAMVIAEQYHISTEQSQIDVATFISTLREKHLLIAGFSQPTYPDSASEAKSLRDLFALPHALEWVEAYYTLLQIHHLLRKGCNLYHLARHFSTMPLLQQATVQDANNLSQKLRNAANWHRHKTACLQHSLALCWMLRRRGYGANYVIGVYTHPFSAHAWVEALDGSILQWEIGLSYPDESYLAALSTIFHSGEVIA